jgi:hypothetical protein
MVCRKDAELDGDVDKDDVEPKAPVIKRPSLSIDVNLLSRGLAALKECLDVG